MAGVQLAKIYDVDHSTTVSWFLANRKQLYDPKTTLFTITNNKTKGHRTPFYVNFLILGDNFYKDFPSMGVGNLNGMYYVPSVPTDSQNLKIPDPRLLDFEVFKQGAKYCLTKEAICQVGRYISWHAETFVQTLSFSWKCSDQIKRMST